MISNQLRAIIKGEIITGDELKEYSYDASIFEVRPQMVVKPKDVEDVKNLVKFVSENKASNPNLSLTVRAGGSDMSGGPLNDSIILDFAVHMNKVIEVSNDSVKSDDYSAGYAIVRPGVFYRDFEKETLKKDLLLPSYPASREICTVGGMVANNAGGEKSLHYGKTENYVEELDVILSDGREYTLMALTSDELEQKKSQNDFEGKIYRATDELLKSNYELIQKAKPDVSKNSAGYALWNVLTSDGRFDPVRGPTCPKDMIGSPAKAGLTSNGMNLTKLFVGSQGTLGIITRIKFRLIKPSIHSKLLVMFLKDLDKIGDLAVYLNKYGPESMESYDNNTFKLALKIFPDLIKKIGILVLFGLIPDIWTILTGGIPKLVVLVEFTGDDERDLTNTIKKCRRDISDKFGVKTRIAESYADVQKYWTIRRESFNLLRKHVKGKKTAPFIDDIIVRPEYLSEFMPELNQILFKYKNHMVYTIAGHLGDGNFHIIPLVDLSDENTRRIIPELSQKVYDLVLKFHGSITAEHNDGLIRTPYLEKMYGEEIYKLFEKTKKIFDPLNIFNPRKKVGADMDYAVRHIKSNF